MSTKKGTISVNTNDIFPIIKKWLYSEHDIFLRELVSNACDAITKRKTIARNKNLESTEGKVDVIIDKKEGTITISDNGLGMSEEEVEKYIAQLAFSGAQDFVEEMKKQNITESKDDIIGKFGLGFYSSFMVADKVEIETLSMEKDSKAVKWTCDGQTEYTFSDSDKSVVGTEITLYINDDSKDFLETYKTRSTLSQYCDFMPYQIELIDSNKRSETFEANLKVEKEEDKKEITIDIINETEPLWKKDPSKISDDEYKTFYRKMFPMDPDPLFWLHLNIDHPFTLQGILYFPKLNPAKPFNEKSIRLYCRQVFVSDNTKNIVPEFLSMLKGAIDSTDIPLNVSRSALQGDPNIKKISNYIIKKVAESLKKLSKNDREKFTSYWEDIGLFVKYGIISDDKFDELLREFILFKTSEKEYKTIAEYNELIPEEYKEKLKGKILFYEATTGDPSLLSQFKEMKIPVIETESYIDPHLTQHLEFKKVGDIEIKFSSIDNEFENLMSEQGPTNAQDIEVKDFFTTILKDDENFEVEVKKINTNAPAYVKIDQNMKKFQQMSRSMGQGGPEMPIKKTLVINPDHALILNAFKLRDSKKELASKIVHHVQDLALISSDGLTNDQKGQFVKRSQDIIQELSTLAL